MVINMLLIFQFWHNSMLFYFFESGFIDSRQQIMIVQKLRLSDEVDGQLRQGEIGIN